jgi:hypothetical protein
MTLPPSLTRPEPMVPEPDVVTHGGTAATSVGRGGGTVATYQGSGMTTLSGPVVRPITPPAQQADADPLMTWLASDEAKEHEGHWVALDPDTAEFLGRADTRAELRHWRDRDVSILFVDRKFTR